jgi:DNA-binding PadR family transcriptional regulator
MTSSSQFRPSPLALTVLGMLNYAPLHPYGIQRLIKQWGKDQVVNVGQRAGLYRTIERLLDAGLIEVRETGRDQQYPERTVYQSTSAGREAAHSWLEEMLAEPKQEFPQFPAALSNLLMLMPDEAQQVLQQRADALAASLEDLRSVLDLDGESDTELPRVTMLESEYLAVVTEAELTWVRSVIEDLRAGRLSWDRASLVIAAEAAAS